MNCDIMKRLLMIWLGVLLATACARSQDPQAAFSSTTAQCLQAKRSEYESSDDAPEDVKILNSKIVEFIEYGINHSGFAGFETNNPDISSLFNAFTYYNGEGEADAWKVNNIPAYLFWDCLEGDSKGRAKGIDLRVAWLNSFQGSTSIESLRLIDLYTAQSAITDIVRWSGSLPPEENLRQINGALTMLVQWNEFSNKLPTRNLYSEQMRQLRMGEIDLVKEIMSTYLGVEAVSEKLAWTINHLRIDEKN
jgi:hypothetical protein